VRGENADLASFCRFLRSGFFRCQAALGLRALTQKAGGSGSGDLTWPVMPPTAAQKEIEGEESAAAEALAGLCDKEDGADAQPPKKQRVKRTHLEAARIKVAELNSKRCTLQESMDILTEKGEENLSATDKKKLATCGGQMAKLDGELKGARDRLDTSWRCRSG